MTVRAAVQAIDGNLVQHHLALAAGLLAADGADGLLVFKESNILGFCGVPLGPSDRLVCGLINGAGQVGFVMPAFLADMATGLAAGAVLFPWAEEENPYATAAAAATHLGIGAGKILLDPHTSIEAQMAFGTALPRATLVVDPGIIQTVRIKKSPGEVEAIRTACRVTGEIYGHVAEVLRPGISERQIKRTVASQLEGNGSVALCELIQSGENAASPHRPTSSRIIGHDEAVIVDHVRARNGYLGDMTRTFATGDPPAEVKRAYRIVREAQRVALDAIRPGLTCEALDHAARSVIEREGLGEYFVHRLGHGIGLDGHEPPYLVKGNQGCLEPGMCVTIEPGVYVPGRFGIRIEDVVVVTEDGCEVLSDAVPTDVSDCFK